MVWGTAPNRFNNAFYGMNIKDRHHGNENDTEHRNNGNDTGKTNQKSHSMGRSTQPLHLRGFIAYHG